MSRYRKYIRDNEPRVIPRSTASRVKRRNLFDECIFGEVTITEQEEIREFPANYIPQNESIGIDIDHKECVLNDSVPRKFEDSESWFDDPIYEDSKITVGEYIHTILVFFMKNSLTKKTVDDLLQFHSDMLPQPNKIPRSRYYFNKLIKDLNPSGTEAIRKHRFCEDCSYYLNEWSSTDTIAQCKVCDSTKINGIFVVYDLRSSIIDAFRKRKLYSFIEEHNKVIAQNDGTFISDITSGSEFKRLKRDAIPGDYDLCILWNTDGFPLTNSSRAQMWPLQIEILNISPQQRPNFRIVCGLFYTTGCKPDMNCFLKPFAETMKNLYTEGIYWYHEERKIVIHSKIIAPVASLDAPARAAVQNVMQYNGEYGCSFCEHPGQTCGIGSGHNHIFPHLVNTPPLRTEERMLLQARKATSRQLTHVKGVKGPATASTIPFFDVSTGFVPDYMHAILLGVVRMLMACWFDSTNSHRECYIDKTARKEIDCQLFEIRPPKYITREPRSVEYKGFWKANELKDFLIFYSPIVLKGKLPDTYYQHWLLLVKSTQILLKRKILIEEIDLSENLLHIFTIQIESLYGLNKCSFNVHQLTHMTHFVRLWGPIWAWSAFPFEDGNGTLLKLSHGTNKIDMELANTLRLQQVMYSAAEKLSFKVPSSAGDISGVKTLGRPNKRFNINFSTVEALHSATSLGIAVLRNKCITTYARVQIGSEVYTSTLYLKQTKRCNYTIMWNNGTLFGDIQYFVELDNVLFAVVRELRRRTVPIRDAIVQRETEVDFSDYIIPVYESYKIHAIRVQNIDAKVLKVMSHICILKSMVIRC